MMQHDADDGHNSHIITASDVNKKLSFQGWEKCVEAFSQGKGPLSHRCLMSQEDTSHLDATISWSSSDEESSKAASQQSRQRPNRLLSSQINFSYCKPVRTGGRKHSSANFVRSIEKRLAEFPDRTSDDLPHFVSHKQHQQIATPSNLTDSSGFQPDFGIQGSETADESVWVKNLSILNKRINLHSDYSEKLSSESFITDSQDSTVVDQVNQEKKISSPILQCRKIRNNRRRNRNPAKPGNLMKEEENASSFSATNTALTSPIFKITKNRRRSSRQSCNAPLSTKKNNSQGEPISCADKVHDNAKSSYPRDKTFDYSFTEEDHDTRKDTVKMSPKIQNKVVEIASSPVIGKSSSKRRRFPAMVVDKAISPIIGSNSKSRRSRTRMATTLTHSATKVSGEYEKKVLMSKLDGKFIKDVSSRLSEMDSNCRGEEVVDESKQLTTQGKSSAKRSLDFSFESAAESKESYDCGTGKDLQSLDHSNEFPNVFSNVILQENYSPHIQSGDGKLNLHMQRVEKPSKEKSQEIEHSINQSCLIEEINTELLDEIVETKPMESPAHLQKKKKPRLSLSTKSSSKQLICHEKKNYPKPYTSLNRESPASPYIPHIDEVLSLKVSETGYSSKDKLLPKDEGKMAESATKKSLSRTLLIEEEFSEPMEAPSQDIFVPPVCLPSKASQKQGSNIAKNIGHVPFQGHLNKGYNKNHVEDVDIDSWSSQSPDESQNTQIEKLPSSGLSSPITISQSSSPPPPASVGDRTFSTETVTDDFNAPPKKGKKKLKPDGLASRLQRLLSRQRSSSRIWQYKRSKQGKTIISAKSESDLKSSMLLNIRKTWTEYSHLIVQGYMHNDAGTESVTRYLDVSSNEVVVVVDPTVAEKLGKIMSATKIRIFPPWQGLKLRGVSLILCSYCIEVVSSDSFVASENLADSRKREVSLPFNEDFESVCGLSLAEIIFPKVVEKPTRLFQYTDAIADVGEEANERREGPACLSTISALVSSHYVGRTFSDGLKLTILRVFQFKQPISDNKRYDFPLWSLLGQDDRQEVCEVLLGCEQPSSTERSIWQDVKKGEVIGKTYTFFGFLPSQRISPFRVSNLWKIATSMDVLGPCDQPVLYVLAAANSVWECRPLEKCGKSDVFQPQFSSLPLVLSENCEPRRVNVMCRLLHSATERMYVTDKETYPNITIITISPTAYVPQHVSKAAVITILDLDFVSGDLRADKYTRLSAVNDEYSSLTKNMFTEEQLRYVANLNPTLPILHKNMPAKSLAMFFGMVVGVDEDSAFMWPACGTCENELLSLGENSEKYKCEKCNDQCENFVLRMSLQVICSCPNLPQNSSVRLKLLQSTIETFLPPTLSGEEGYDMNAVLGRNLGPLKCEVLLSKDGNFTLQEL